MVVMSEQEWIWGAAGKCVCVAYDVGVEGMWVCVRAVCRLSPAWMQRKENREDYWPADCALAH